MELVYPEELVLRDYGFEAIHSVRKTEIVDLETLSFVMEGTSNVRAEDRLNPCPIHTRDPAGGPPRIVVDQSSEVLGRNQLDLSESRAGLGSRESLDIRVKRS